MDERTVQPITVEKTPPAADANDGSDAPAGRPIDDPRALTILTTEHWSLLSARSLVYNEAFARGGMFLSFLSATLVALGLVSTATGFSDAFLVIAAVILALDLFVGLATAGRVASATGEDIRYLQGMNRLRHAYHEAVPGLEPYFITSSHDDLRGIFAIYGATDQVASRAGVLHGFTTTIGMIGVICAAVAGVLVGVLVLLVLDAPLAAAAAALVTFLLSVAWSVVTMTRKIAEASTRLESRFPSPGVSRSRGA